MTWSLQDIWNTQVTAEKRPLAARDYIYASEIGQSFLDRYFKMKGIPPSNPYEDRVLRIFDTGRVFEWIVGRILILAGVMSASQEVVEIPATNSCLAVHGRIDYRVGGKANWDQARAQVLKFLEQYHLNIDNEFLEGRAVALIDTLSERYPDGLEEAVVEVKSINSMAFWAHKNRDANGQFLGYPHHRLQLYTYLRGGDCKMGRIFYISKDDLCLEELGIMPNEELERLWKEDVEEMTGYYRHNLQPKAEEPIVFNDRKQKWEVNWRLERSPYLTLITGQEKDAWAAETETEVRRKNLEIKWNKEAKKLKIETEGKTMGEIKKECMAVNRAVKKKEITLL